MVVSRAPASALASDAYATGSVLVSLHLAGAVDTDHPAYRRGLDFLIRTQREDGSWYVKSRSRPFQTYFESGFPHGPDQFISAAASGWAVAALALACPLPERGVKHSLTTRTRQPPPKHGGCGPRDQPGENHPRARFRERGGQHLFAQDLGFEVQAPASRSTIWS